MRGGRRITCTFIMRGSVEHRYSPMNMYELPTVGVDEHKRMCPTMKAQGYIAHNSYRSKAAFRSMQQHFASAGSAAISQLVPFYFFFVHLFFSFLSTLDPCAAVCFSVCFSLDFHSLLIFQVENSVLPLLPPLVSG